jgi:hypothetical protein
MEDILKIENQLDILYGKSGNLADSLKNKIGKLNFIDKEKNLIYNFY